VEAKNGSTNGTSAKLLHKRELEKASTLAASANPIAPEEEIDAVVEQVPEVQQQ
jgi:hypothetical protein